MEQSEGRRSLSEKKQNRAKRDRGNRIDSGNIFKTTHRRYNARMQLHLRINYTIQRVSE